MTNLAFVSLFLFILAIPGYISRLFYFSKKMSRAGLPRPIRSDLALSLAFSLCIHGIALCICWLIPNKGGEYFFDACLPPAIDPAKVVRFFSGDFENTGPYSLNSIVFNIRQNILWVVLYMGLVVGVSISSGIGLRKLVWRRKWDLKSSLFRFENHWNYRFTGRGYVEKPKDRPFFVVIDILVKSEEISSDLIYSGIFETFTTESNGDLRDLVLRNPERWHISKVGKCQRYESRYLTKNFWGHWSRK